MKCDKCGGPVDLSGKCVLCGTKISEEQEPGTTFSFEEVENCPVCGEEFHIRYENGIEATELNRLDWCPICYATLKGFVLANRWKAPAEQGNENGEEEKSGETNDELK